MTSKVPPVPRQPVPPLEVPTLTSLLLLLFSVLDLRAAVRDALCADPRGLFQRGLIQRDGARQVALHGGHAAQDRYL